jgi:hypothetical protein
MAGQVGPIHPEKCQGGPAPVNLGADALSEMMEVTYLRRSHILENMYDASRCTPRRPETGPKPLVSRTIYLRTVRPSIAGYLNPKAESARR